MLISVCHCTHWEHTTVAKTMATTQQNTTTSRKKNSHRKYVNRISLEWSRSVASEHTVISFGFVPNDQTSREPTHSNHFFSVIVAPRAHSAFHSANSSSSSRFTPQIDSHSFSFRCTHSHTPFVSDRMMLWSTECWMCYARTVACRPRKVGQWLIHT